MSKIHEKLSDKNINFLIGSGASVPIYKTLSLGEDKPTLEDLLSSKDISDQNKKAILYLYYKDWIKLMAYQNVKGDSENETLKNVFNNYNTFIKKIVYILSTNGNEKPKKANIFTTNYDLLFEYTFESIISNNQYCYFNDGSRGFINRTLRPESFNLSISQMGYTDNFKRELPTINLIKIHGSISWNKADDNIIEINYNNTLNIQPIPVLDSISLFDFFKNKDYNDNSLENFNDYLDNIVVGLEDNLNEFTNSYNNLAIINPEKHKFNETVFEQHYYQMIRSFSYELEKKNTVLIVFAFSFSDEHILEILKRALTNPSLEVLVICYSKEEKTNISSKLMGHNIQYYPKNFKNKDESSLSGDFTYFNSLLNGDFDE